MKNRFAARRENPAVRQDGLAASVIQCRLGGGNGVKSPGNRVDRIRETAFPDRAEIWVAGDEFVTGGAVEKPDLDGGVEQGDAGTVQVDHKNPPLMGNPAGSDPAGRESWGKVLTNVKNRGILYLQR